MEGRIVPELGRRQPATPLPGCIVNGAPQIHFHALVDAFNLLIRLWVIRRGVEELGAGAGEKLSPQLTLVKTLSRSETIEEDTPWSLTMLSQKALATCAAVNGCFSGTKWANLVKWSTTTMIES